MLVKKNALLTIGFALSSICLFAQEGPIEEIRNSTQALFTATLERQNQAILQQLDSIKFVNAGEQDIDGVAFDLDDVLVVRKLNALSREVPLDYNQFVRKYITLYNSKNYSGHMSRMLGLGQYYFPLYEKILAEVGVPKEIKYLSIIESALNPHDVSRVGATGPWQFMYGTAKIYDLTMDSYIDERKDPIASSYAAAKYIKEAYAEFGDWLLAIASYNCGKGGVKRAILKSGKEQPSFWEIAAFLPKETRNYIPAYIAMTYTLGYAQEHGIEAFESDLALQTEVLAINKYISIANVAKAINVSEENLKKLNPAYKKGVVNGTTETPRRLIIPSQIDNLDKDQLYLALNTTIDSQHASNVTLASSSPSIQSKTETRHRVKNGESLASIARKYGVSVQNLKAWNKISTANPRAGTSLLVSGSGQDSRIAQKGNGSSSKASTMFYTVVKGDNLWDIANRKGVSVAKLKADNNLSDSKLKPGMKLKISKVK